MTFYCCKYAHSEHVLYLHHVMSCHATATSYSETCLPLTMSSAADDGEEAVAEALPLSCGSGLCCLACTHLGPVRWGRVRGQRLLAGLPGGTASQEVSQANCIGGAQQLRCCAFSHDGMRLTAACLYFPTSVLAFFACRHMFASLCSGTRLASVSFDCAAKLWVTASGEPLLTFRHGSKGNDDEMLYCCAFSPDAEGRHVLNSGSNGTADLCDSKTVAKLVTYHGHNQWVGCLLTLSQFSTLLT